MSLERREFIQMAGAGLLATVGGGMWVACTGEDAPSNGSGVDATDDRGATGGDAPDTSNMSDGAVDETAADQTDEMVTCVIDEASGESNTHGHLLSIPKTDIDNPQDRLYQSTGGGHDHTVALTASELEELGGNCTVTVSSNDTHAHTWVITIV